MLEISLMGAIAGNQLLKQADLCAGTHEDPHHFQSSYHLLEEKVDLFKYDIKTQGNKFKEVQMCLHQIIPLLINQLES